MRAVAASGLILGVFSVFGLASAHAQSPVTSYRAFLAADSLDAARALGAVRLDSTREIDSMLLEQRALLARYFGFSASIQGSNLGIGSYAQEKLGITLDLTQVLRLKQVVEAEDLTDVLRFVLAHEWAHLVQFDRYSLDFVADSTNTRALECEADAWAGLVITSIALDSAQSPREFQQLARTLGATAFELGSTGWTLPTIHPRPEQRALCVTVGQQAAMDLNVSRLASTTRNGIWIDFWRDRLRADSTALRAPGDTTAWIRTRTRVVLAEGGKSPDYIEEIRAIARAANEGAAVLRATGARLRITGARWCGVDETSAAVQVRCEFAVPESPRMASAVYDNWKALMRWPMGDLMWTERQEVRFGNAVLESFVRTDQRAVATVILNRLTWTVTISIAAYAR